MREYPQYGWFRQNLLITVVSGFASVHPANSLEFRPIYAKLSSTKLYTFERIKKMGRPSYREKIIASGMQTVHERGFSNAGLREISAAAGVAQGSFTNHFSSKDEFGVAILDHYFELITNLMADTLEDQSRSPMERLGAYFDAITAALAASGWRYGCLAGNMALESSETSELIRQKLDDIFARWTPPFAAAIRGAQAAGEVAPDIDADETSQALLDAWHGAMLRMKIERSPAPLERFRRIIFPGILRAPNR